MTPAPEADARQEIDRQLQAAGWIVQDRAEQNIHAGAGVAVREFPLPGHGFADYLLYVNGRAAGVVEAKPAGTTLTGVELQARRYADAFPSDVPARLRPLPLLYRSTGVEMQFTNRIDPAPAPGQSERASSANPISSASLTAGSFRDRRLESVRARF